MRAVLSDTSRAHDLNREKLDLILERFAEGIEVPVDDDGRPFQLQPNLTRCDTLIANMGRNTLLEVTLRFRNGDRAEDRNVDLDLNLNLEAGKVVGNSNLEEDYQRIVSIYA